MSDTNNEIDFQVGKHYRVIDRFAGAGVTLWNTSKTFIDPKELDLSDKIRSLYNNRTEVPVGSVLTIIKRVRFTCDHQPFYCWLAMCPHAGVFWIYGREFTYCKNLADRIQKIN